MTSPIDLAGWAPGTEVVAAEMAVAGAAIQHRDAAETAADVVKPTHFYTQAGMVFAAALALVEDGRPVDEAAVLGELAKRGDLDKVGGGAFIATLMEHAALPGAVEYHARKVVADSRRRRLYSVGEKIQRIGSSPAFDAEADPELARKMLDEALVDEQAAPIVTAGDLLWEVLDGLENRGGEVDRVKTGYRDLDRLVTIRPGQLIIVGARPGVGKSILGIDILRHLCVRGREPGLLHSMEMSKEEVMHRLIAAEGRVSLEKFQNGKLDDSDWDRIAGVRERINDSPLVIDDTPEVTLAQIRSKIRTVKRTVGCRLVVVDYLQLMKPAKRSDNRQQDVAELSRGLKLLAREMEIPIVVAAQVNRGSEHRTDKTPQMSDLRESGAIEADADVVLLLHREEMYDPEGPRAGEMDVIVAKQRQGARGTVVLGWQGHYGRCTDLAPKAWSPTASIGGAQ